MRLNELIKNEIGLSYNLILKGMILGSKKQWSESLLQYKEALKLRLSDKNLERLASIYYYIGNCFIELEKPDSALAYYLQAIDKYRKTNGKDISFIVFGKYYAAIKDYKLAEYNLIRAIEMLKTTPNELLLELHEILSRVYYEQKDYKNAFIQQFDAATIKDSLSNIDNTRKITQLEKDMEFKVERIKYESNLGKQQRLTYGLGIILIISIAFVYLIYKNLRYHKETNAKLNKLNSEITSNKLILEKNNEELEKLNATKDKFFSIIAHDLKNPFNSILGLSEILKEDVREFSIDEIEEYAGLINDSSRNTLKLLENLLDWARIQRGRIEFRPSKFDLNEITETVFSLIGETANQKKVTLVNSIPGSTIVEADENMVNTILRNLISNAVKFSWENGVVEAACSEIENKIHISISDTGVGMNEETVKKLFELNSGISTKGTNNEKGTGLGLILCKDFIEMHGQKLSVESEVDKGSIFHFTLPKTK